VIVRLSQADGSARIEVFDEGPGFPVAFLPRAFERFTRADEVRGRGDDLTPNQGLGLAIVAAVAAAHGGTVDAHNRPGGGAVVVLRWPQPAGRTVADPTAALAAEDAR
jgi:signal transduction histidine kinase